MNQYFDLFDPKRNLILSASARYIERADTDNPLITALPPKRNMDELVQDCTKSPGLPPQSVFQRISLDEKLMVIQKLNSARIYLPYYAAIEETVDRALVNSYERRAEIESKMPKNYTYQDTDMPVYQFSDINELSDAPTGFSLIGASGCGKSTGINAVLRKYPKIIIHNEGTTHQFVQIPILAVHMAENNNFHGLYQRIGWTIDRILGNTAKAYENELGRKGDTLAVKFNKLCNLINIFHIGLLVIDEIELISVSNVKEGSLETFMSLSNITGIAIGVVGTEDAYAKLFHHPRITRRIGDLINADSYCSSKNQIKRILYTLYTYLPSPCIPSDDCVDVYYQESNGVIAYISRIFTAVASEIIKLQANGEPTDITPKTIKNIAKKHLAGRYVFDKQNKENRIIEDEEYSLATARKLMESNEPLELPEAPQIDRMPTIRNIVKEAIHAFCGSQYADKDIESALHKIMKTIPDDNIQGAIAATLAELKCREKAKAQKEVKKKQQEQALVDLKKLKETLPVFSNKEDVS